MNRTQTHHSQHRPPERCGCPGNAAAGLSRRGMFQLAGAAGLTVATTASQARVAFAAGSTQQEVLVVVSLRGGMDGLNMIAPIGDPSYARVRPNIHLQPGTAIALDKMFGMHPAMSALTPAWKSGKLAVVHATGMPEADRSHFSAMQKMEEAAPGSSERTGWIDRMIGLDTSPDLMAGANLGGRRLPASLLGPTPAVSTDSIDSVRLITHGPFDSLSAWQNSLGALHSGARPELLGPMTGGLAMVEALAGKSTPAKNGAAYPDSELGLALKDVATLVRLNIGLRVATVDMGEWDMHANMGTPQSGWLHDNAADLAGSLAAFATDLGPDLNRVCVVTLSEFGRRVAENGSGGVDHGHGNAVLMLGGGLNGGKVYGRWPGLDEASLDEGNLAVTTDYRAVLGEVLSKRHDVKDLSKVFPGYRPTSLGVVKS
jgi:uncharacterized protein (DUF1501 family)